MKFNKTITLKNGRKCLLRNGIESDGQFRCDTGKPISERTV